MNYSSQWGGFGSLNLSGVDAEGGGSLKPGSYTCKITSAEVQQTKDKTGHGLKVEFSSVDGGGSTSDYINLNNRNAQAVEIGMKRLKALLVASGHPNPDRPGDVKTLIGRTVGVHVEAGENWTNDKGETKPGAGKPRRFGAYYKVDGAVAGSGGGAFAATGAGATGNAILDDEIPFMTCDPAYDFGGYGRRVI